MVNRLGHTRTGHNAVKIFVGHGDRTVYQISKGVGQLGIQALHHQFPGNDTIILKGHFMQHEVTHSIYPEKVYKLVCIDDIPFGFAHLAVPL